MSISGSMANLGSSTHCKNARQKDDFYTTNPDMTKALLSMESFSKDILEPCCGNGAISKILADKGFSVVSSDLNDNGFGEIKSLFDIKHWHGDIISNPPYKNCLSYVEYMLDIVETGAKVALFLKLLFIETKGRKPFLLQNPPKTIHVSSSRVNCFKDGKPMKDSSPICYSWFVWEKGFNGDTILKLFN